MAYINGNEILFSAVIGGGSGSCSRRHIIEVSTLPTVNIVARSIYLCGGDYYVRQSGGWKKLINEDEAGEGGTSGSTECTGDHIIEASNATEMTSLLSTATVGTVVKYIGTTTDTYENGALYIVEAVIS